MTEKSRTKTKRRFGVLLHPTSLFGPHGIGTLGAAAHAFVDWLAAAGAAVWQVLPLVPADEFGSPYSSWSALAGNPDLIDLDELATLGLLEREEAKAFALSTEVVSYREARLLRAPLLARAVERLARQRGTKLHRELMVFCEQAAWAQETARFMAIKRAHGGAPWWRWPTPLRNREPRALDAATRALDEEMSHVIATQFLFERQWQELKRHANSRGVEIMGDIPIYVDADSVDVWANRELFDLDEDGQPSFVAGVPPDAFSETGQRWGNPLYLWDVMAKSGYAWWKQRLRRALELTDLVRIDHFRALASYFAIPRAAADGTVGEWRPGPGMALLEAMRELCDPLPIIAEDLGIIGDDVRELLQKSGLPGMLVLQFAFGRDGAVAYQPHSHTRNAVVYTGTHDNDTTRGFYEKASEEVRDHLRRYLGRDGHDMVWDLIRAALASVAKLAVIPMQDLLNLDSGARMNTPAVAAGNWRWRLRPGELREDIAARLRGLASLYSRVAT